jgi:hypothetical protein
MQLQERREKPPQLRSDCFSQDLNSPGSAKVLAAALAAVTTYASLALPGGRAMTSSFPRSNLEIDLGILWIR